MSSRRLEWPGELTAEVALFSRCGGCEAMRLFRSLRPLSSELNLPKCEKSGCRRLLRLSRAHEVRLQFRFWRNELPSRR